MTLRELVKLALIVVWASILTILFGPVFAIGYGCGTATMVVLLFSIRDKL